MCQTDSPRRGKILPVCWELVQDFEKCQFWMFCFDSDVKSNACFCGCLLCCSDNRTRDIEVALEGRSSANEANNVSASLSRNDGANEPQTSDVDNAGNPADVTDTPSSTYFTPAEYSVSDTPALLDCSDQFHTCRQTKHSIGVTEKRECDVFVNCVDQWYFVIENKKRKGIYLQNKNHNGCKHMCCWTSCKPCVFTRATAYSAWYCKAFLFICLSVCQMCALWQNERNLYQRSYTTWKIIHPSFWQEEWLVGVTFLPEILVQTDPAGAKTSIFNRYLLVPPQQ